jgi:hypothetical protein
MAQLSAESRHLAREFLDVPHKFSVAGWAASAQERRREDDLCDAVCTLGRGVELNLSPDGFSGLNVAR